VSAGLKSRGQPFERLIEHGNFLLMFQQFGMDIAEIDDDPLEAAILLQGPGHALQSLMPWSPENTARALAPGFSGEASEPLPPLIACFPASADQAVGSLEAALSAPSSRTGLPSQAHRSTSKML
jgi:hypothetical protein